MPINHQRQSSPKMGSVDGSDAKSGAKRASRMSSAFNGREGASAARSVTASSGEASMGISSVETCQAGGLELASLGSQPTGGAGSVRDSQEPSSRSGMTSSAMSIRSGSLQGLVAVHGPGDHQGELD